MDMSSTHMISKSSSYNEGEKVHFSSPIASELHPDEIAQGAKTRKRRRRTKKATAAGDAKKRRLTDEQVKLLEARFTEERRLECSRKVQLSTELGMEPKQVAVWFQNRRARHKSKGMEAAFLELQSAHNTTVIQKCQLENQVLQLKEKLSEAQEELMKLYDLAMRRAAAGDSDTIGSPSTSALTCKPNVPVFGTVEAEADLTYVEYNNYMMEWAYHMYSDHNM